MSMNGNTARVVKQALEAALFSDLSMGASVPCELVTPDGRVIVVKMRSMKAEELRRKLLHMPPAPTAPLKDMRRNAQGNIERVLNENDPTYLEQLSDHNAEFGVRCLVDCMVGLDIPGETEEERYEAFNKQIDGWALKQLMTHFNRINGLDDEAIALARERLNPLEDESTPSLPVSAGASSNGKPSKSVSNKA